MTRRLQQHEIKSASGTLTDMSALYIDDMPLPKMTPKIKKLLKSVSLQTKQLAITKPFNEDTYIEFEEIHRQSIESIKPGDPATVTMEWLDIVDEPFIVERVEGLRVYLRRE